MSINSSVMPAAMAGVARKDYAAKIIIDEVQGQGVEVVGRAYHIGWSFLALGSFRPGDIMPLWLRKWRAP